MKTETEKKQTGNDKKRGNMKRSLKRRVGHV